MGSCSTVGDDTSLLQMEKMVKRAEKQSDQSAEIPAGMRDYGSAILGGMPGGTLGGMMGGMMGGMPGAMPGGMPAAMPGGMPAAMFGGMPGATPGGGSMPGGMPAGMPGGMTPASFMAQMGSMSQGGAPGALTGGFGSAMVGAMSGAMQGAMQGGMPGPLSLMAKPEAGMDKIPVADFNAQPVSLYSAEVKAAFPGFASAATPEEKLAMAGKDLAWAAMEQSVSGMYASKAAENVNSADMDFGIAMAEATAVGLATGDTKPLVHPVVPSPS